LFLRSPPLPPRHPTPTLFPYTTLFRSIGGTPGTRPPPLRGRASERAADAVVREPEPAKLRRVVEIPCVHDQRLLQETYDFCEIGVAVFQPFGDDRERVGAAQGLVGTGGVLHPAAEAARGRLHRGGIVHLHVGIG